MLFQCWESVEDGVPTLKQVFAGYLIKIYFRLRTVCQVIYYKSLYQAN